MAVVAVGVEQGIVLAIVASVIDHLRHSYRPATSVLVPADGDLPWRQKPVDAADRTLPGLVVYRFASSLYYANANHLVEELVGLVEEADQGDAPIRWVCLDAIAMADIDYSGSEALRQLHGALADHHVRLVLAEPLPQVRALLDRYGLTDLVGQDAIYPTLSDAVAAFRAAPDTGTGTTRTDAPEDHPPP